MGKHDHTYDPAISLELFHVHGSFHLLSSPSKQPARRFQCCNSAIELEKKKEEVDDDEDDKLLSYLSFEQLMREVTVSLKETQSSGQEGRDEKIQRSFVWAARSFVRHRRLCSKAWLSLKKLKERKTEGRERQSDMFNIESF